MVAKRKLKRRKHQKVRKAKVRRKIQRPRRLKRGRKTHRSSMILFNKSSKLLIMITKIRAIR